MKALGGLTLLQCSLDGVLPEIQEDGLVHLPSFLYKVLPLSLLLMVSRDLFHKETMKRQPPYCPGGSAENNFHQPVGQPGRCWVRAQLLTAGPSSWQGRPGYLHSWTPGIVDSFTQYSFQITRDVPGAVPGWEGAAQAEAWHLGACGMQGKADPELTNLS